MTNNLEKALYWEQRKNYQKAMHFINNYVTENKFDGKSEFIKLEDEIIMLTRKYLWNTNDYILDISHKKYSFTPKYKELYFSAKELICRVEDK